MSNKGFTLIEVLVAVGVIAILSAGVVGLIGRGPSRSARDGQRKADLQKIATALELYKSDKGYYPTNTGQLIPTYLSVWPTDPTSGWNYGYTPGSVSCGAGYCDYKVCSGSEVSTTGSACVGGASCGSTTCRFEVTNP